jgi:hypothetical protein
MNFCVQDAGGGLYQYTFTLTLDNHDNSWTPGYGIGWIVFADAPQGGVSPLNDFVGDPASLPIGPWDGYSTTGGGHNGPNLSPVVVLQPPYPPNLWVPNAVGDFLTWRGTSSHLVPAAQMQWSTLEVNNGTNVNFETMGNTCGPTGACCTNSGCQVLTSSLCSSVGGAYHGDGSQCTSCPAVGACCTDSGCSIMTQANCSSAGGLYQGDNSTCPTASYTVTPSSAQFVDISTTGTLEPTSTNCDDCFGVVPLPFTFSFYGAAQNSISIASNGFLSFDPTATSGSFAAYNNDAPPTPAQPNNAIYPAWDDLYFGSGGIYYQADGVAPNRTFTVAWINRFQYQTNPPLTFECILYEGSNNIEFRYGDIPTDAGGGGPNGSDYTIGVENASGTVATVIPSSDIGTGHTARMLSYVAASCGPHCGSADFNHDGDSATDLDIEDFFACIAGNCCATCDSADFNGDGDSATDADIEAFFRVLAGGHC